MANNSPSKSLCSSTCCAHKCLPFLPFLGYLTFFTLGCFTFFTFLPFAGLGWATSLGYAEGFVGTVVLGLPLDLEVTPMDKELLAPVADALLEESTVTSPLFVLRKRSV